MVFKVGDRVRNAEAAWKDRGYVGTVRAVDLTDRHPYTVVWDIGGRDIYRAQDLRRA